MNSFAEPMLGKHFLEEVFPKHRETILAMVGRFRHDPGVYPFWNRPGWEEAYLRSIIEMCGGKRAGVLVPMDNGQPVGLLVFKPAGRKSEDMRVLGLTLKHNPWCLFRFIKFCWRAGSVYSQLGQQIMASHRIVLVVVREDCEGQGICPQMVQSIPNGLVTAEASSGNFESFWRPKFGAEELGRYQVSKEANSTYVVFSIQRE